MSYENLPDPRPLGVKFALIVMTLVGAIGLSINFDHPISWGGGTILAGLLAVQYFIAIRWADFYKSWPRRRTYRKHRLTR
jgi:hypothetical protein